MAGDRKSKISNQQSAIAAPDVEAQAVQARLRRVAVCEAAVQAALMPILRAHRCRLVTVQEIVDGQPGPVRIRVAANE